VKIAEHYARATSDPRRPTLAMRINAANRFARGFPEAAVAELDSALELAPQSAEVWKRLADLHRDRGQYSLAVQDLDHALSIAKNSPPGDAAYSAAELQRDRGRVLFGLGRYGEAATAFAEARSGGHPAAYEEALIHLSAGRKDQAIKLLGEAAQGKDETAAWAAAKLQQLAPSKP
jgi:tetratricopeptide (TPR) repeat protein